MSNSEGSTESVVIKASNCSVMLYCVPLPVLVLVMAGMSGAACANKGSRLSSTVKMNPIDRERFMVLTAY